MGEENKEWGKPQLYLGEKPLAMSGDGVIVDEKDINVPFKVIGMDSDWNKEAPTPKSIECSITISRADYDRMLMNFVRHMAHELAQWLTNYTKLFVWGSHLPREKKKWAKKIIANRIYKKTGTSYKHVLKLIRTKRK